jgi:FixJ family two-component response regulator
MTETETGLIAIVDDDRLIRRSLERLLKSAGLTAKSFDSAEDYLDVGDHNGICCIILDIGLPGMSGFELHRRLAAEPNRLPVVFISAHDEPDVEDQATQAGAIAFLRKPFEDNALLNAVQTGMELLKNRRK